MRLKTDGMFLGIEREGMLSGIPTLFVQGLVDWPEIEAKLKTHARRHLELGAGRNLVFSHYVLNKALESDLLDYVTVETADVSLFTRSQLASPKLHLLVTLLMRDAAGSGFCGPDNRALLDLYAQNPRVQIKVDTGVHIAVMSRSGLHSFNRNDIFFSDTPLP